MKELKALTRKTEGIEKKLSKLDKAKVPKKAKAKAKIKVKPAKKRITKKPAKATAIDTVFAIIKKSKKGVGAATLKKKTGFDNKKIYNVINSLKKKGKVKSIGQGVYVKV